LVTLIVEGDGAECLGIFDKNFNRVTFYYYMHALLGQLFMDLLIFCVIYNTHT
jgi:hypothetical protein